MILIVSRVIGAACKISARRGRHAEIGGTERRRGTVFAEDSFLLPLPPPSSDPSAAYEISAVRTWATTTIWMTDRLTPSHHQHRSRWKSVRPRRRTVCAHGNGVNIPVLFLFFRYEFILKRHHKSSRPGLGLHLWRRLWSPCKAMNFTRWRRKIDPCESTYVR